MTPLACATIMDSCQRSFLETIHAYVPPHDESRVLRHTRPMAFVQGRAGDPGSAQAYYPLSVRASMSAHAKLEHAVLEQSCAALLVPVLDALPRTAPILEGAKVLLEQWRDREGKSLPLRWSILGYPLRLVFRGAGPEAWPITRLLGDLAKEPVPLHRYSIGTKRLRAHDPQAAVALHLLLSSPTIPPHRRKVPKRVPVLRQIWDDTDTNLMAASAVAGWARSAPPARKEPGRR